MHSAFDWLVATRDQLNIKFVQGLGDIVESGSFFAEWDRASVAWNKLYGQIPFVVNQGNHDSISSINRYFPVANFESEPWWGGSYEGIHNSYQVFNFYGEISCFLNVQSHDPWGTDNPGARAWAKPVCTLTPRAQGVARHPRHLRDGNAIKRDILTQHDNIVYQRGTQLRTGNAFS